jgi:hypothetical protein
MASLRNPGAVSFKLCPNLPNNTREVKEISWGHRKVATKEAVVRTSKRVCVIGAGPSGITAAKNFKDLGFDVTVFEAGDHVGGNWRFNDATNHASVFETTHIISSKISSQYEDYPLPADAPDYPHHAQLLDYFQGYARHFKLMPSIQFNTIVTKCDPLPDGRWNVSVESDGKTLTSTFDALAVCNGHHWKPRWPEYPGTFSGEVLHSHGFKRADPFKDKRILVVGGGNSACDIAVETSRVSKYTEISWRRGYWLVPKFVLGNPSDAFYYKFSFFPRWTKIIISEILLRLLLGKNSSIGLQNPDHWFGSTHPTVNSELYYFIRHGRVKPRVDILRFEGNTVHFKDGTKQDFDTVIYATGYWINHPFFDKSVVDFSQGPVPLYLRFLPANLKNCYFIGLFQPLGCIWPGAELQSKIAARHLAGLWTAPADLGARIQREIEHPDYNQLQTPRHTITVDDIFFRKKLRRELARSTKLPMRRSA